MPRPKGSQNRATKVLNDWLDQNVEDIDDFVHPLAYLLDIVSDVTAPEAVRLEAAAKCLPYVARKMPTQVEHSGRDGDPIELVQGEAHRMLENLLFDGSTVLEADSEELH